MAKLEQHLTGDFGQIVEFIHQELMRQSMSISLEECSKNQIQGKRIELRVYERFSYAGGNRTSLTVQFIETKDGADVCGIPGWKALPASMFRSLRALRTCGSCGL